MNVNGDLPAVEPLALLPGGTKDVKGFWEPDPSGILSLATGETITLACPGSTLTATGTTTAVATCVSGTGFDVGGSTYTFSDLGCESLPFHDARRSSRTCPGAAYEIIEIGFTVEVDFYRLIDVCFDDSQLNSVYSNHTVVKGIGGYESGYPRPYFLAGNFYGDVDVNTMYTQDQQTVTVGDLLGDSSLGSQYVVPSTDHYMARGHLAAKADFVFGANQRATFWYINVAPQWQTFNGGNWEQAEFDVRTYADFRGVDLMVYTGTYGVATLPNVNGIETELYLAVDSNNNKVLPVPKLYWKLVHEPISNAGINNPYVTSPSSDYYICNNVCDQVSWLNWVPDDAVLGFSYCCEVGDFQTTVSVVPFLNVNSLLV